MWVEMALTDTGLAIGLDAGPTKPGEGGYGIGQHLGAYPVLFRANNVEQAVEEFAKINYAGKGVIIGLADADGNGAIIDKSGTSQGLTWLAPQQGGILGTNHFHSDAMKQFNLNLSSVSLDNERARRTRFSEWLPTTRHSLPNDAIEELFSNQPFCQTGQYGKRFTEAATISSPSTGTIAVSGLPPSWKIYKAWDIETTR